MTAYEAQQKIIENCNYLSLIAADTEENRKCIKALQDQNAECTEVLKAAGIFAA